MKKILFVTAFVPSRVSAGENYSRQIINKLAQNYIVDLICFSSNKKENYQIENNNVNLIKVFNNFKFNKLLNWLIKPYIFPVFNVRFNTFRIKIIKDLIKSNNYKFVILDYSQCFYIGDVIKESKILISHDVLTQRYNRVNPLLTQWVKKSENLVINHQNSKIFTFSNKDKSLLKEYFNVDSDVTSFFLEKNIIKSRTTSVEDYFIFFARWGRNDNKFGLKWFVANVLPNLPTTIKFKIIGIELDKSISDSLSKYNNIELLGFVENPYPIIANAKALIAPLFSGAGVKVKVIDSLACGTPVIGTDISFEGINSIYDKFMIRCENSDQFISTIENFKISIDEKLNFKHFFLKNYEENSIIDYVNKLK